jgi:hypothetical protein
VDFSSLRDRPRESKVTECVLDLVVTYGRDTVRLHGSFNRSQTWSSFLSDFAFNENKSIRQTKCSGERKVWSCSDQFCPWYVSLTFRRQPKSDRSSKLSHIPLASWYVHGFNLPHRDTCSSVRSCTVRQMRVARF